jgi:uncharacterized protein
MEPVAPGGVPSADLQARLRLALRAAIRERDPAATPALRSALAALANAEAVPAAPAPGQATGGQHAAGSQHVAGTVHGLGAAEVPRRRLTGAEEAAIVQAEISDREEAARDFGRAGHHDRAERLRREAAALAAVLASPDRP